MMKEKIWTLTLLVSVCSLGGSLIFWVISETLASTMGWCGLVLSAPSLTHFYRHLLADLDSPGFW